MGDIQRGVVKWFNDAKGFGFIEHTSGRDVFVHYSVIQTDGFKTLKDGEEVDYELCEGDKGLHAAKVFRAQTQQVTPKDKHAEEGGMVAPRLESGSLTAREKSASEMIEVERSGSADSENALPLSPAHLNAPMKSADGKSA